MIVYKVTCINDGRVYIGKTIKTLKHRRQQHEDDALRGSYYNHFHSALKKYGISAFSWEVIDQANTNFELLEKEKFWIKHHDSINPIKGFNITAGGQGLCGYKHSQATKDKIREAHKGKALSVSTKEKLRLINLGKKLSAEHKAKMSLSQKGRTSAMKGKTHTEETKQKMRMARLGKRHTAKSIAKMRVVQANKTISLQTRERLRIANLGKVLSLETRMKISIAVKKRFSKPTT